MSSIFFQISGTDFLEANKIYGGHKEYALRIVSFKNGVDSFIYLPEVTLAELSLLGSILQLKIIPDFRYFDGLKKYWYAHPYYY